MMIYGKHPLYVVVAESDLALALDYFRGQFRGLLITPQHGLPDIRIELFKVQSVEILKPLA